MCDATIGARNCHVRSHMADSEPSAASDDEDVEEDMCAFPEADSPSDEESLLLFGAARWSWLPTEVLVHISRLAAVESLVKLSTDAVFAFKCRSGGHGAVRSASRTIPHQRHTVAKNKFHVAVWSA